MKGILLYVLSAACLLFHTGASAQGYGGLVARWSFNGNAHDVSGHGLNGIVYGASLTKGYAGAANTAYQFNNGNYIYVPYDTSMNMYVMSVCALVKPIGFNSTLCQANSILWRGYEGSSNGYKLIYLDNNYDNDCNVFSPDHETFGFDVGYNSGPSSYYYTPVIDTQKWYCVVGTYSADDTLRLYVDGALKNRRYFPVTYDNSTNGIVIGMNGILADTATNPYYMNAVVDEIRLYNRALSADDVNTFCDSAKMILDDSGNPASVNTLPVQGNVIIYPNPAKDFVTIQLPGNINNGVAILYNALGLAVQKEILNRQVETVNMRSLPAGVYIIRLNYDGKQLIRKIEKD